MNIFFLMIFTSMIAQDQVYKNFLQFDSLLNGGKRTIEDIKNEIKISKINVCKITVKEYVDTKLNLRQVAIIFPKFILLDSLSNIGKTANYFRNIGKCSMSEGFERSILIKVFKVTYGFDANIALISKELTSFEKYVDEQFITIEEFKKTYRKSGLFFFNISNGFIEKVDVRVEQNELVIRTSKYLKIAEPAMYFKW